MQETDYQYLLIEKENYKIRAYNSVPLRFLFEFKKKETYKELRLYMYLRFISIDRAGYIPPFFLTKEYLSHRQRYITLPKLKEMGWITKNNRLKSVHKILAEKFGKEEANNVHTKISYTKNFISNKKFKDYIFSLTEKYIMRGKYLSETKGIKVYDPRSKTYKRQRMSDRSGTPYETFRVRRSAEDYRLIEPRKKLESARSLIYKKMLKIRDKKSEEYKKLLAEFQKVVLSLNELYSSTYVPDIYFSRISHSMLEKWGYKPWEISRRRSAKINQYSKKECIPVDPEIFEEMSKINGKVNVFYDKKQKCYVRYLPTEVLCDITGIYYYSQHTGKKLEKKSMACKSKCENPVLRSETSWKEQEYMDRSSDIMQRFKLLFTSKDSEKVNRDITFHIEEDGTPIISRSKEQKIFLCRSINWYSIPPEKRYDYYHHKFSNLPTYDCVETDQKSESHYYYLNSIVTPFNDFYKDPEEGVSSGKILPSSIF